MRLFYFVHNKIKCLININIKWTVLCRNWLRKGFKYHSTQNKSFRRRSSPPISWHGINWKLRLTKQNGSMCSNKHTMQKIPQKKKHLFSHYMTLEQLDCLATLLHALGTAEVWQITNQGQVNWSAQSTDVRNTRHIHKPSEFDVDVKSSLKSWKHSDCVVHVLLIIKSRGFGYVLHVQPYTSQTKAINGGLKFGHNYNKNKLDGCYCIILYSGAQSTLYLRCHLTNNSKASNALNWNLNNQSATLPQKWVKGDLHIFHQNVGQSSLFRKNISHFHMLSHLVTTTHQIRAPSHIWQNLRQFSHLPENMGTRRQIQ